MKILPKPKEVIQPGIERRNGLLLIDGTPCQEIVRNAIAAGLCSHPEPEIVAREVAAVMAERRKQGRPKVVRTPEEAAEYQRRRRASVLRSTKKWREKKTDGGEVGI